MISKNKLLVSVLLLFSTIVFPNYSQDSEEEEPQFEKIELYSLGDQNFSINAGLFIPLFFMDMTPAGGGSAVSKTNLGLGGTGSLIYEAYLTGNIKVGAEVGGMFAYSPNNNPFFMVPITARIGYEFHFGQFSLPLYLGTGINIITYEDDTNVQILLKPGASLYYNYNSDWSFGGNLVYWISPEFIFADTDQSRIGNFLDFTISAQYHF